MKVIVVNRQRDSFIWTILAKKKWNPLRIQIFNLTWNSVFQHVDLSILVIKFKVPDLIFSESFFRGIQAGYTLPIWLNSLIYQKEVKLLFPLQGYMFRKEEKKCFISIKIQSVSPPSSTRGVWNISVCRMKTSGILFTATRLRRKLNVYPFPVSL